MCTDQPYCLVPYIVWLDCEPVCMARISLSTRSGVHSITGPHIMCDYDPQEGWWSAWTPCDFPAALSQLGIPQMFAHLIMEEVTERLVDSPQVSILLDGAQLLIELLPAPDAPAVNPH
ncbi:hypothetical protein [Tsukamurella pseudospumae]|uniref:Uncharacterized protein n=1 Tax=Tsukamurella pseudospumae TaxID=239498 RepID=A0A138A8L4_9ACTN|nr:hypothetical protein [Tsukamurella pseudospumae]KXP06740.1 hypothetical protein AXK60_11795 [Tsukamurella pseudospumae]